MCILKWTVKFFRTMNNYTCLVCMPCWCSCSNPFCFTIHVALGNTHNSYYYFLCDNIGTKYVQYVGFGNKIKEMNRCAENVSNATDTKHRFTIFLYFVTQSQFCCAKDGNNATFWFKNRFIILLEMLCWNARTFSFLMVLKPTKRYRRVLRRIQMIFEAYIWGWHFTDMI